MTVALEDLLKMSPEEILTHNEKLTAEQLRNKQQTYFEEVYEGMPQVAVPRSGCGA